MVGEEDFNSFHFQVVQQLDDTYYNGKVMMEVVLEIYDLVKMVLKELARQWRLVFCL